MELTFLLLVAFIFSSDQCQDTDPVASPAFNQLNNCNLTSKLFAMQERLVAMACTQDGLLESVRSLKAAIESMSAPVSRVAFTAVLGQSLGPISIDTPVKYPLIISNMGNAYNPATGTFTARVPGMYYFSYTMYNNNDGTANSVMSLMKNGQKMVSTWDVSSGDPNDSATNAAVLELGAGDSVYIQLYATRKVYDDVGRYNTFSGFLLFPL